MRDSLAYRTAAVPARGGAPPSLGVRIDIVARIVVQLAVRPAAMAALDTSPGIYALPAEMLCHIFAFLSLRDLMVSTHVCHFWRETALAEPTLWTHISLNGLKDPYSRAIFHQSIRWTYPTLLEDLLQRSRSLPVQLRVCKPNQRCIVVLCEALRRHMHRIRALYITGCVPYHLSPDDLPAFAPPQAGADGISSSRLLLATLGTPGPLLEILCVQDRSGLVTPSRREFLAPFPRLQEVNLIGWRFAM